MEHLPTQTPVIRNVVMVLSLHLALQLITAMTEMRTTVTVAAQTAKLNHSTNVEAALLKPETSALRFVAMVSTFSSILAMMATLSMVMDATTAAKLSSAMSAQVVPRLAQTSATISAATAMLFRDLTPSSAMMVTSSVEMDVLPSAKLKLASNVLVAPQLAQILALRYAVTDLTWALSSAMMETPRMATAAAPHARSKSAGHAKVEARVVLTSAKISAVMAMFGTDLLLITVMMATTHLETDVLPHATLRQDSHALVVTQLRLINATRYAATARIWEPMNAMMATLSMEMVAARNVKLKMVSIAMVVQSTARTSAKRNAEMARITVNISVMTATSRKETVAHLTARLRKAGAAQAEIQPLLIPAHQTVAMASTKARQSAMMATPTTVMAAAANAQ